MQTPSKFLSMSAAARLLGVPYASFRKNFLSNFYPFSWYRVSPYRMAFKRADIELYAASIEPEPLVRLPEGETLTGARREA